MEPTKLQNEDFQEQAKNVSLHHSEGMRRDNESIDDFEHLEPESSPVKEFQGLSSQAKVDEHPILKPEIVSAENVASSVNSNTADSTLFDASNITEENKNKVGDVLSSMTSTLLDSKTSLFGKDDFKSSELPEKTGFSQQSSDLLLGLSYGSENKPDVHNFFTTGEKSEFGSDLNKMGSQKALSQAFMDTERETVLEGPTSHGDDLADLDFTNNEKDTKESDFHPTDTISSLPQDIKQHDFMFDSDTVLEPSKPDSKMKGKSTDEFGSSKSLLSAHDDEFHDDISSQDEKSDKTEPDEKPTPAVEPEHKSSATAPEPIKQFASVVEPSLKPEPVPSSKLDNKPKQEKPSDKPVPLEIPAKSKPVQDENDLDEIKPIQLFQFMGLGKYTYIVFLLYSIKSIYT